MKNNYYNENFDSETIQEKIKVKNKTKSSKPINYGKMILEEQKKKKEELRKQRNFEKAQQKKQKIYEKLEKQRQKKSYKK